MWLTSNEIDLLNQVYEDEKLIPLNRKGKVETEGFKLRDLSFFYSDTKAITNVCNNLKDFSHGVELRDQYLNVLRKMGLINDSKDITELGDKLLLVLHNEDNRIINEIKAKDSTVSSLSKDIPYKIEFFLYLSVMKSMTDKQFRINNNINYNSLFYERIDNLDYFFSNIIDTIKERSTPKINLSQLFELDREEFYYFIQGINFTGYEIKRFLKLDNADKERLINLFNKLIECKTLPSKNNYNNEYMILENGKKYYFTDEEKLYRRFLHYYKGTRQKDIRIRVKHSILNYIIYSSIRVQNNKSKLEKNRVLNEIIPYDKLNEVVKEFDLLKIYDLVFLNKYSNYKNDKIKLFVTDELLTSLSDEKYQYIETKKQFDLRNINKDDDVIFIALDNKTVNSKYVYKIIEVKESKKGLVALILIKKNLINIEKFAEYLL